ncbi:hypothetical protein GUJ93_ZPchr0002g23650 [Zizania palustris]|uniref:Uncharacterized protein n=1 Tax=Zizania palustris TaxID=103762 RepID=A0A8J5S8Q0_ZIZPA|nr:hypothetical protein GUJ93_ZPchr0002g23650 [Zizania palustris]
MEKRDKLVAGLTRKHMIRSGSSSSSPTDSNRNRSEGGDHNPTVRPKKGKAKALKWRVSNTDMNSKREACGSDGDHDDTVLSSVTTASFSSQQITRKRVKSLGKVTEECDAIDPPVPRKLRSAIRLSQWIVKQDAMRYRQLAKQISKEEEKIVVDALLSLSQIPPPCELSSNWAIAEDSLHIKVASASYSAESTKEDEEITALPTAGNEVAKQSALKDEPAERACNVPQINPVLSEDGQRHDISSGIVTNLPSPSKDYNNSSRKQLKVQFDDSAVYPAKPEAPRCLVNSRKLDLLEHVEKNVKNNTAQDAGMSFTSTLAMHNNTATEIAEGTGKHENLSLVKNGAPSKTWKRSITHVYACHLIQKHLNEEKASQNRVKPEQISHSHISRSSTLSKNCAHDEKLCAMHLVQPSSGVWDTNTARQKMVAGNFLNLPTSATLPGAQHVQYLHPQIAPPGAMPYPIQHLPYSRGNLTSTAVLQQMPRYMCNPSLPASTAVMEIQQVTPSQQLQLQLQQQQQQMWQFHFPQYQARQDAAAVSAAWHQSSRLQDISSLRQVPVLPPPPPPPPPQMELFCAPYQGGGGRQPPQLRLI